MGKLPNPNESQKFETVYKDKDGLEVYGERTVDGLKEIVHIPSGKSNMTYYKPEKTTFYEQCRGHEFQAENIANREVECRNCHYSATIHVNDFEENKDGVTVKINGKKYPLIPLQ